MVLPAWLAAMVQLPAARAVTVLPLVPPVVQIFCVVLVKVTGLPEAPPVADTVPLPPTEIAGTEPKLTLCAPALTAMVCVVCGAAV